MPPKGGHKPVPRRQGTSSLDEQVKVISVETLSQNWGMLKKHVFEFRRRDGSWQKQSRETYDRGDAAAMLLCDIARGTVILLRQFRIPLFERGDNPPMLIEACAGRLDGDDPATCAKKEAEEEAGYRVSRIEYLFQAYMSPGSVTEKLHFYLGYYEAASRFSEGGGLAHEGEDIEVLELPFARALAMIGTGEIADAKTIMLLQAAAMRDVFGARGGA